MFSLKRTVGKVLIFAILLVQLATPFSSVQATETNTCGLANSLTLGQKGKEVTLLQDFLYSKKYQSVRSTGTYTTVTKKAVSKWQKENNLPATGLIDKTTLEPLNVALCEYQKRPTPQSDFYRFINQDFLENGKIPTGRASWGAFERAQKAADDQVQIIINEARETKNKTYEQQVISALYDGYSDTAARTNAGIAAVEPLLNMVNQAATLDDLFAVSGKLAIAGFNTPIGAGASQDFSDPSRIIIEIGQPLLALPSREYYVDEKNSGLRGEFKSHIAKLFELSGLPSGEAEKAYEFEMKLGLASLSAEDRSNPKKNNNPMTFEEFQKTSKLNWSGYFQAMGIKTAGKKINYAAKDYVEQAEKEILSADLSSVKAWLKYWIIRIAAPYATDALDAESYRFNGNVLAGIKGRRSMPERALSRLNGVSIGSYALGKVYVATYFPKQTEDRLRTMVSAVKSVLKNRIQNNVSWLSSETKKTAQQKLDNITLVAGVPDAWPEFEKAELTNDYLANVLALTASANKILLPYLNDDKVYVPFTSPPQVANAQYDAQGKRMTFFAGLFNQPFYAADFDDSSLYGGIGVIIGHELTHAFDSIGSQFDENGKFRTWWTELDAKNFEKLTTKLAEYISSKKLKDGTPLNGRLLITEATADLGGITIAWEAFKQTESYQKNEVKDGYTARQRFFIQYAKIWAQLITPEAEKQYANSDPHPPAFYRANETLKHFTPFYQNFDIKPGDQMYLAPGKRIKIW